MDGFGEHELHPMAVPGSLDVPLRCPRPVAAMDGRQGTRQYGLQRGLHVPTVLPLRWRSGRHSRE